MTRAIRNTWLISSSLGTRPSSSWRATAILALRSRFFCSVVAIYQLNVSQTVTVVKLRYIDFVMSCDTYRHRPNRHPTVSDGTAPRMYQKRSFSPKRRFIHRLQQLDGGTNRRVERNYIGVRPMTGGSAFHPAEAEPHYQPRCQEA